VDSDEARIPALKYMLDRCAQVVRRESPSKETESFDLNTLNEDPEKNLHETF